MPRKSKSLIPIEEIDGMIRLIRGVRVMLDRDLARIYGVPTKVFNQAVNAIDRDFLPEAISRRKVKSILYSPPQKLGTALNLFDSIRTMSISLRFLLF